MHIIDSNLLLEILKENLLKILLIFNRFIVVPNFVWVIVDSLRESEINLLETLQVSNRFIVVPNEVWN